MQLNEKGYCLTLLPYGLFASISLQESARDRSGGVAVTELHCALCWVSLGVAEPTAQVPVPGHP